MKKIGKRMWFTVFLLAASPVIMIIALKQIIMDEIWQGSCDRDCWNPFKAGRA